MVEEVLILARVQLVAPEPPKHTLKTLMRRLLAEHVVREPRGGRDRLVVHVDHLAHEPEHIWRTNLHRVPFGDHIFEHRPDFVALVVGLVVVDC